jgi:hypothetical protein
MPHVEEHELKGVFFQCLVTRKYIPVGSVLVLAVPQSACGVPVTDVGRVVKTQLGGHQIVSDTTGKGYGTLRDWGMDVYEAVMAEFPPDERMVFDNMVAHDTFYRHVTVNNALTARQLSHFAIPRTMSKWFSYEQAINPCYYDYNNMEIRANVELCIAGFGRTEVTSILKRRIDNLEAKLAAYEASNRELARKLKIHEDQA